MYVLSTLFWLGLFHTACVSCTCFGMLTTNFYAGEPINTCNIDQFSFKGFLSRFMWASTLVAPFTKHAITELLTASSSAAARSCSGGTDGVTCGTKWYVNGWDGTRGVGQQMSALETIQGLLIDRSTPPLHDTAVYIGRAPTSSIATVPTPDPTSKPDPKVVASSAVAETKAATQPTGQSGAATVNVSSAGVMIKNMWATYFCIVGTVLVL